MSNASANSSVASKEVKMGFKVSGGFFKENKNELEIKPKETINKSIPMFEIVENSFGTYKRGKDSKGRDVIVTATKKFVKEDKNSKFAVTTRTRNKESR